MAPCDSPRRRLATYDALRNPHFRWFWFGMLASSATMQMGRVAQGWLVYDLSGSAFALGWSSVGWSISNAVLSPWGGVISDRLEKRRLLLWSRALLALSSLVVAVLAAVGVVVVWHLAVYSLFRGALFAVLMPAQNAYLTEIVDHRSLLNAVSLNSVGMGLTGIVAAPLAGLAIEAFGVGSVYLGVSVLYWVVFLAMLKLPLSTTSDPGTRSVWSDVVDGARYLWARQVLLTLLAMAFLRGFLAMPYRTLMPKYASDVMALDASGLGILVAAPSVGSLISSLGMASLGAFAYKGKLLLGAGLVMGLALVLFGNSEVFAVVLVLLAVIGATGNIAMVANRTLIQVNSDGPYMGRAMSAYMMMFGLSQLGTLPIGAIADQWGVRLVVTAQGALLVVAFLVVWLTQPKIKRLA